jgi:hypothetical protein
MPTSTINGIRLFRELTGKSGEPLVLVHGSWVDHQRLGRDPLQQVLIFVGLFQEEAGERKSPFTCRAAQSRLESDLA